MDKKELKKKKRAILDLSHQINVINLEIGRKKEQMDIMKEEVRGLMKELSVNFLKDDRYEVSISYPSSVDHGMLKMKYPELWAKFVYEERVVKRKVRKGTKDVLRFEYPEAFKVCVAEGTPRLRIKNIEPDLEDF